MVEKVFSHRDDTSEEDNRQNDDAGNVHVIPFQEWFFNLDAVVFELQLHSLDVVFGRIELEVLDHEA